MGATFVIYIKGEFKRGKYGVRSPSFKTLSPSPLKGTKGVD